MHSDSGVRPLDGGAVRVMQLYYYGYLQQLSNLGLLGKESYLVSLSLLMQFPEFSSFVAGHHYISERVGQSYFDLET